MISVIQFPRLKGHHMGLLVPQSPMIDLSSCFLLTDHAWSMSHFPSSNVILLVVLAHYTTIVFPMKYPCLMDKNKPMISINHDKPWISMNFIHSMSWKYRDRPIYDKPIYDKPIIDQSVINIFLKPPVARSRGLAAPRSPWCPWPSPTCNWPQRWRWRCYPWGLSMDLIMLSSWKRRSERHDLTHLKDDLTTDFWWFLS